MKQLSFDFDEKEPIKLKGKFQYALPPGSWCHISTPIGEFDVKMKPLSEVPSLHFNESLIVDESGSRWLPGLQDWNSITINFSNFLPKDLLLTLGNMMLETPSEPYLAHDLELDVSIHNAMHQWDIKGFLVGINFSNMDCEEIEVTIKPNSVKLIY